MAVVRDLRVLLRLRDFRRLLAVRLLTQLSDGVFQVALATYVVFSPEKQASPAAIASAMAVLLLPYSLLGPFTGVLLDRWRRRQVLLYCNLLRAVLSCATAALILARVPDWLFYLSALSVTAVNRFVLAGLSAALPRVVDDERLVMANSLSPTAGTLAATAGGGLAFLIHLGLAKGAGADATVVLLAAFLYLCAGLAALAMARDLLGPDPALLPPRLGTAVAGTVQGLADGLRHLRGRPDAVRAMSAMTALRFCYGALTVALLMLCRYAWNTAPNAPGGGLALLGLAVGVSGAGFFAAAVVTPWATDRFGTAGWITVCAGSAAVLLPPLALPFAPAPMLIAAFALGMCTQGAKIATDTVVQSAIDDAYRGRVFSLYDVAFNVAFVGAAAVAALMLPPDGRSAVLIGVLALLYAGVALTMLRGRPVQ
ncbi:MFS transporter [Streptomyces sp. H10-C2]|uniref:MFS transporter n=1 Tax=unclassified Streptomyces TaxID=2593676 RepID=UPI0024BA2A77|nr:MULTISPECIES: MFS transporter [unclassified Streptomyces]MDJ0340204.1 MFS transporter [Streptomyces sp. PH10-H1]MDJ0368347.1 MFS transporter [Streptomyces sp. H10-C2]